MSSGPLRSSTQLDLLQLPFRKAKLVLVASRCYSVTTSCLTLCDPMDCSLPGFPVLHYLLELAQTHVYCGEGNGNPLQCSCLENPRDGGAWWAAIFGVRQSWTRLKQLSSSSMSIESVMPSNHFIICRPLLLPSIFSIIRVFSNDAALCTRWSNYWSFNFSISLSNEYSGLISFRIDWFDLLAVRGTLKNLFQHHTSKAPIHLCSAYLSHVLTSVHDYWKNHSFDYTYLCQQSNVSAM